MLSITSENVIYFYQVKFLGINTKGQDLGMAYMDISPTAFDNVRFWYCSMVKTLAVIIGQFS